MVILIFSIKWHMTSWKIKSSELSTQLSYTTGLVNEFNLFLLECFGGFIVRWEFGFVESPYDKFITLTYFEKVLVQK